MSYKFFQISNSRQSELLFLSIKYFKGELCQNITL